MLKKLKKEFEFLLNFENELKFLKNNKIKGSIKLITIYALFSMSFLYINIFEDYFFTLVFSFFTSLIFNFFINSVINAFYVKKIPFISKIKIFSEGIYYIDKKQFNSFENKYNNFEEITKKELNYNISKKSCNSSFIFFVENYLKDLSFKEFISIHKLYFLENNEFKEDYIEVFIKYFESSIFSEIKDKKQENVFNDLKKLVSSFEKLHDIVKNSIINVFVYNIINSSDKEFFLNNKDFLIDIIIKHSENKNKNKLIESIKYKMIDYKKEDNIDNIIQENIEYIRNIDKKYELVKCFKNKNLVIKNL